MKENIIHILYQIGVCFANYNNPDNSKSERIEYGIVNHYYEIVINSQKRWQSKRPHATKRPHAILPMLGTQQKRAYKISS